MCLSLGISLYSVDSVSAAICPFCILIILSAYMANKCVNVSLFKIISYVVCASTRAKSFGGRCRGLTSCVRVWLTGQKHDSPPYLLACQIWSCWIKCYANIAVMGKSQIKSHSKISNRLHWRSKYSNKISNLESHLTPKSWNNKKALANILILSVVILLTGINILA